MIVIFPYYISVDSHSKRAYLFFDTVYLVKNKRNDLLNSKKFVYPAFGFSNINIQCPAGYITW